LGPLEIDVNELGDATPTAAAKTMEQKNHYPKHLEREKDQPGVFAEKAEERSHKNGAADFLS
jgi:hypothetical protein